MITYQTTIKMHETDAGYRLFFGNQFKMAHDAYEILLDSIGYGMSFLLRECEFFLPIVHAEADYKAQLMVGDKISIRVQVEKIGTTSYTIFYTLVNENNKEVGTAKTIHVAIDKKTGNTIPVPEKFRAALEQHLA